MRVVVVGKGAREHAICASLVRHHEVVCTTGNPGIAEICQVEQRKPEEIDADLYVIGPEVPLVDGLADRLRSMGRKVFGPGADGAKLEGSKAFLKEVLRSAGVPTARFAVFSDIASAENHLRSASGPYVIKTDGLAEGKGVKVAMDLDEALFDVRQKLSGSSFGDAGRRVVIEDYMSGPEVSLFALCDGESAAALPVATDFKRLFDGDLGDNTGGMGAHSPVPWGGTDLVDQVMQSIVQPTLVELKRRGIEYRGVLYAGLILTEAGPKIVEYNVRFGDPETQVVIPRITSDLGSLLLQAASGRVEEQPTIDSRAALTVVLSSEGYPTAPKVGREISGLVEASNVEGVKIFQAGTALRDGVLVTAGGRVVSVTALADTLSEARTKAYLAASMIRFDGVHYRTDIGAAAVARIAEWAERGNNR